MATEHKTILGAKALGKLLRQGRKTKHLSLLQVSSTIKIDVAQLSRFENGEFKLISKNLQEYINYLQINNAVYAEHDVLVSRFANALKKSDRHFEAAMHAVLFLESFDS